MDWDYSRALDNLQWSQDDHSLAYNRPYKVNTFVLLSTFNPNYNSLIIQKHKFCPLHVGLSIHAIQRDLYIKHKNRGKQFFNNSFYSTFIDKVECNCHFPAPGRNCYNTGKLILLFLWSDT
jgi:hypothetical protein